jgi:hypothetical protein
LTAADEYYLRLASEGLVDNTTGFQIDPLGTTPPCVSRNEKRSATTHLLTGSTGMP